LPKIRAVFTDIDNTLTSPVTHQIPASAIWAIEQARQNGIKVFAATGRNLTAYGNGPVAAFDLDGYVTVNGQLCYLPDGQILRMETFDPAVIEATLNLGSEHGFFTTFLEKDQVYLNGINTPVEEFYKIINTGIPTVVPDHQISREAILSIVIFVYEEMDALFEEALPNCQVVRWNPYSCDLAPKIGGKDVGIRKMLEYFEISMEETLAIGDGGNDVSMLKAVGIGVAVGNARPEAIEAADYLAPEVDDDAILKTFQQFGLI